MTNLGPFTPEGTASPSASSQCCTGYWLAGTNKQPACSFLKVNQAMFDDSTSDASLLHAFTKGDAGAADFLVARYRQALFSWFVGMTGNHADAEDLFQELWIRVIRHADRFNDVSFKAWLWKIARNLVIDFRRKKRPDVSLDAAADDDDKPLVAQLEARGKGPAEAVELDDLAKRVLGAVQTLPPVQREVFLMRVQGDLSFSDIARTLDIPLNTALGRMHDAMTKLKKVLAEE